MLSGSIIPLSLEDLSKDDGSSLVIPIPVRVKASKRKADEISPEINEEEKENLQEINNLEKDSKKKLKRSKLTWELVI